MVNFISPEYRPDKNIRGTQTPLLTNPIKVAGQVRNRANEMHVVTAWSGDGFHLYQLDSWLSVIGRASNILFLRESSNLCYRPNILTILWYLWPNIYDFNEVLHTVQLLCRVRWWTKSLKLFQNCGNLKYTKNGMCWTDFLFWKNSPHQNNFV